MSEQDKFLEQFQKVHAVLKGHFQLSSGLHSDTYVQCAKLLEHPGVASEVCAALAGMWRGEKIDVVAGPAYGGIVLAYELARAMNCRAIFFERVEGKFTLRRGFELTPRDRVLIAEDVVTTGGSAQEVLGLARQMGAHVVGITSLVNRGQGTFADTPYHALLPLSPPHYTAAECPLCRSGVPITQPGSRGNS